MENPTPKAEDLLLGKSTSMQVVHELIRRMAKSPSPALILGESGTGKEMAAKLLHLRSNRRHGPFVAVNCAAIPSNMLESELFGHTKGSFTGAICDYRGKFELADNGTLFLDEIGELRLDLQPKILRAIQEQEITPVGGTAKKIDVRIVAATNRDLEKQIHLGKFREDLFYRLAVLPLIIPPLRERSEDVPVLAEHFLDRYANGRQLQLAPAAVKLLKEYLWPGNVRELENLMERLSILSSGQTQIDACDLPGRIQVCSQLKEPLVVYLPQGGFPLKLIERQAIMLALAVCNGNRTMAAKYLDIPRHVLAYRLEKYGDTGHTPRCER